MGCDPQQELQLLVIHPRDCLASSLVTWMMGQGTPSISLLIIHNREKWLIQERVVLLSRGVLTGWSNGLTGLLRC